MKLVCLSDTHNRHRELKLPPGDVLLHAGDFTRRGTAAEIQDFNAWLGELPYRHKIVIAGNHDFLFEQQPDQARQLLTEAIYLEDSGIEIAGIHFWGSPVSPRFFDWAFNRERGSEMAEHWSMIPTHIDILLTHTPPHGLLDRIWSGKQVGCEALRIELMRIQPLLLVCGHIHESSGHILSQGMNILNACSLNRYYQPVQPVWTVELDPLTHRLLSVAPQA